MRENREIKFRVWNKTKKKFWLPKFIDDIVYERDVHTVELEGDEDYVLQQYSGLKDKTGREIYEGDIIIFMGRWDEKGNVLEPDYKPYQVIWFIGGLRAIVDIGCRSIFRHGENVGVGHTDSEIIGNIFENPELLNKNISPLL